MSWADEQLHSFIDRVLRLKKQQDELAGDIKEIYAEAKASGFDKTIMGQLVAHLRKQEKDPHGFEEKSAIFDMYLHAYEHGTPLATRGHAHAGDPPHDEDGVIIEDVPKSIAQGDVIAPAPGAGGPTTATGDAGERPDLGAYEDASPINSEHDAQHEATVKTTSPAPVAASPASSQEPCTHGSGAVQDRCESTAPTLSPSGDIRATGTDGGSHEVTTPDPEPIIIDMAALAPASATIAPVDRLPSPDSGPGALIPCEANGWAGLELPPMFDRLKEKAA